MCPFMAAKCWSGVLKLYLISVGEAPFPSNSWSTSGWFLFLSIKLLLLTSWNGEDHRRRRPVEVDRLVGERSSVPVQHVNSDRNAPLRRPSNELQRQMTNQPHTIPRKRWWWNTFSYFFDEKRPFLDYRHRPRAEIQLDEMGLDYRVGIYGLLFRSVYWRFLCCRRVKRKLWAAVKPPAMASAGRANSWDRTHQVKPSSSWRWHCWDHGQTPGTKRQPYARRQPEIERKEYHIW